MDNNILNEYDKNKELYINFGNSLKALFMELLRKYPLVSIEVRVKDKESLRKKIEIKDKYTSISDITDVIGVRIITYLPDSVDQIASFLRNEFKEHTDKSVDKRKKNEDQFGYMSLHLIMQLNSARKELTEYREFTNIPFEVQIKTVLQHAWAEIEHDLGYKDEYDIPSQLRRRFFRLSSILELADEEFQNIVNSINNYKETIRKNLEMTDSLTEINYNSIKEYLISSNKLETIAMELSSIIGNEYSDEIDIRHRLVERLLFVGFKSIEEIDNALDNKKELIDYTVNFLNLYYKDSKIKGGGLTKEIGLFYLVYLRACELGHETVDSLVDKFFKGEKRMKELLKSTYEIIK